MTYTLFAVVEEVGWSLQDVIEVLVGFGGWIVAVITLLWTRSESRLQSLSELLQPFVKAMRHLFDANTCRRKCEELRRAFPKPENAREAAERVNANIEQYNQLINLATEECRNFEREFATRHFRFPDKVSRLLLAARDDLFRAGELVSNGMFERSDLQIAKIRDHYKEITAYARGWRLTDPIEGLRKRLGQVFKKKEPELPEFELSEDEMERIFALVHKRFTTQSGSWFAVHPPKKLIEHPEICKSDDVIDQLVDSIFEVVFQDGTYQMMSLTELIVFTHQLMLAKFVHMEAEKVAANLDEGEVNVNVSCKFAVPELMRPETVKLLLSKINFSDSPSDGPHDTPSPESKTETAQQATNATE